MIRKERLGWHVKVGCATDVGMTTRAPRESWCIGRYVPSQIKRDGQLFKVVNDGGKWMWMGRGWRVEERRLYNGSMV